MNFDTETNFLCHVPKPGKLIKVVMAGYLVFFKESVVFRGTEGAKMGSVSASLRFI